jgi:S-adenosylmethionine/arginine decarboxylase-like enzyme
MECKYSPTGEAWGLLVSLDVYGCSDKRKDADALKEYVTKLCDEVIHMKRFGECHVEHFGNPGQDLEGLSFFQFIETSCVSGHCSDTHDECYIDVFSCADFDPEEVASFTVRFFDAREATMVITPRLYDRKKEN